MESLYPIREQPELVVLVTVAVFIFGALMGSFLFTTGLRLATGPLRPLSRSRCSTCGSPIAAYDNLPLVSFIFLRGRCRHCDAKIPWSYFLMELGMGILFTLLWAEAGSLQEFAAHVLLAGFLVVVSVVDLGSLRIPDVVVYPGIAAGIAVSFLVPHGSPLNSLLGVAVGSGVLGLVSLVYRAVRGRLGLGLGDIKLAALIGSFLGWQGVILSIALGAFLGSSVGLAMIVGRRGTLSSWLPFAPFSSVGALLFVFLSDRLGFG